MQERQGKCFSSHHHALQCIVVNCQLFKTLLLLSVNIKSNSVFFPWRRWFGSLHFNCFLSFLSSLFHQIDPSYPTLCLPRKLLFTFAYLKWMSLVMYTFDRPDNQSFVSILLTNGQPIRIEATELRKPMALCFVLWLTNPEIAHIWCVWNVCVQQVFVCCHQKIDGCGDLSFKV